MSIPESGSSRRALAIEACGYFFVGPDNGIFWPIIRCFPYRIINLSEQKYFRHPVSSTFHGRDIFAPVAAWIAGGEDIGKLGTEIDDPVKLDLPEIRIKERLLEGHAVRKDQFGNLITDIGRQEIFKFIGDTTPVIRVGKLILSGISQTYSDVSLGEPLALIGSSGRLEISVNGASAAELFSIEVPAEVIIEKIA